jgi:hypothetical protein
LRGLYSVAQQVADDVPPQTTSNSPALFNEALIEIGQYYDSAGFWVMQPFRSFYNNLVMPASDLTYAFLCAPLVLVWKILMSFAYLASGVLLFVFNVFRVVFHSSFVQYLFVFAFLVCNIYLALKLFNTVVRLVKFGLDDYQGLHDIPIRSYVVPMATEVEASAPAHVYSTKGTRTQADGTVLSWKLLPRDSEGRFSYEHTATDANGDTFTVIGAPVDGMGNRPAVPVDPRYANVDSLVARLTAYLRIHHPLARNSPGPAMRGVCTHTANRWCDEHDIPLDLRVQIIDRSATLAQLYERSDVENSYISNSVIALRTQFAVENPTFIGRLRVWFDGLTGLPVARAYPKRSY